MEIKVNQLKSHIGNIKSKIEDYESDQLNYNNAIKEEMSYWQDDKSNIFFSNHESDQSDIATLNTCLYDYLEYFTTLTNSLSNIGNNIFWDSGFYEQIVNYCETIISKLDLIIGIYNSMNIYKYPSVSYYLRNELTLLKGMRSTVISVRDSYGDCFRYLDGANNQLAKSLNDFSIPNMPNVDIHKENV